MIVCPFVSELLAEHISFFNLCCDRLMWRPLSLQHLEDPNSGVGCRMLLGWELALGY